MLIGSIGWGVLTRLSGTIVPAIIMHGLVDAAFLFWMWQSPERFAALAELNVLHTGPDGLFLTWVAIAVIGTGSTIYCFFRLHNANAARAD